MFVTPIVGTKVKNREAVDTSLLLRLRRQAIEPLLGILAVDEEPGGGKGRLEQRRGTVGMTAVRLDEGQDVRGIGVPLAAVIDGLQDLLRVIEPLEPIVDGAECHESVEGLR